MLRSPTSSNPRSKAPTTEALQGGAVPPRRPSAQNRHGRNQGRMRTTGRDYPLGVDCGSMIGRVRDILTLEGLAYATYDYPEMVEDMVETACLLIEDFLDQVLPEFDFDYASGWEDICYNRGPLVSLDFFEHVVVPATSASPPNCGNPASTSASPIATATCAP